MAVLFELERWDLRFPGSPVSGHRGEWGRGWVPVFQSLVTR